MPRSTGSLRRQVAVPAAVPSLWTEIAATTPAPPGAATTLVTWATNGPIPATAKWATIEFDHQVAFGSAGQPLDVACTGP